MAGAANLITIFLGLELLSLGSSDVRDRPTGEPRAKRP